MTTQTVQVEWATKTGDVPDFTAEQLHNGGVKLMDLHFVYTGNDWDDLPEDTIFISNCAAPLRGDVISVNVVNPETPLTYRTHYLHTSNLKRVFSELPRFYEEHTPTASEHSVQEEISAPNSVLG